jgi:hypothetical protein
MSLQDFFEEGLAELDALTQAKEAAEAEAAATKELLTAANALVGEKSEQIASLEQALLDSNQTIDGLTVEKDDLRRQLDECLAGGPPPPPPTPKTLFGTMGVQKADTAAKFGAIYRIGAVIPPGTGTGKISTGGLTLADVLAAGMTPHVMVKHSTGELEVPLPDDGSGDAAFRAGANMLMDACPAETSFCMGNEVDTQSKWQGTVAQYTHIMALFAEEAHKRGLKVGGVGLLSNTMLAAAGVRVDAAAKAKGDSWIDACKAAGMDYFVFHSYTGDPAALATVIDYARTRFGGEVYTNEIDFRTTETDVTTGPPLVQACRDKALPIALWYGNAGGSNAPTGLFDLKTGVLTPAGQSVVDAIGAA